MEDLPSVGSEVQRKIINGYQHKVFPFCRTSTPPLLCPFSESRTGIGGTAVEAKVLILFLNTFHSPLGAETAV